MSNKVFSQARYFFFLFKRLSKSFSKKDKQLTCSTCCET